MPIRHALPCLFLAIPLAFWPSASRAEAEMRTLVVRERAAATLLDGAFTFRVLKIRGYSIDIRIAGEKRLVKLGQSIGPGDADCRVIFEEISPETRIARFATDCR